MYLIFKCKECGKTFILLSEEYDPELQYLTCPYNGKHKSITVQGKYSDIRKCMESGEIDTDKFRKY